MMSLGHFLYIPGILGIGIVIGFIVGGRAAEMRKDEAKERGARRSARDARRRAAESRREA